jgi:ankyrin repeat protein
MPDARLHRLLLPLAGLLLLTDGNLVLAQNRIPPREPGMATSDVNGGNAVPAPTPVRPYGLPPVVRSEVADAIVADDVSRLAELLPAPTSLNHPIDWDGLEPEYGRNPYLGRVPPVWVAVEAGATNCLRWLLERGADADVRLKRRNGDPFRYSGLTPLEFAMRWPLARDMRANVGIERWTPRDMEVLRLLLRHGADVFGNTPRGDRPNLPSLEQAGVSWEVIDVLVTNAVPATIRDSEGTTLLHIAAAHWRAAAVEHLLRAGLSPSATNASGLTPLQACLLHVHPGSAPPADALAIIQRLRDAGAPEDMCVAAALGRVDTLNRLITATPGAVEERDGIGRSPLHHAVSAGQVEAVEWLLKHGADPAASDRHGDTPLHVAALGSSLKALQRLVKAGAPIDALNRVGETPLVCGLSHLDAVEFLLDAGASAEPEGEGAVQPLVRALEWNSARPRLLRMLVQHGARMNRPASDGSPLLHFASRAHHDLSVIGALVRLGADLEAQDSEGNTLLLLASGPAAPDFGLYSPPPTPAGEFVGRVDWLRDLHDWLVTHKVIPPKSGPTQVLVSGFLLKLGANPRATNHFGNTALHLLARRSSGLSTNVAMALLEGGVDPMARNRKGNTFLHELADPDEPFAAGDAPVLNEANLRWLFRAWTPPTALLRATNAAGKTAAELAIDCGYTELAQILTSGKPGQ